MKKHYAPHMRFISEKSKNKLVKDVVALQQGNESSLPLDNSKYPLSLEQIRRNADSISKALFENEN